jgi:hypothetical protein
LAVDPQHPAQEVDRLHLHREGLALAQAGAGRHHDQRPVAGRHRLDEGLHLLGRQRLDALRLRLREPDAVARRGDDQPSRTAARNVPARNE